MTSFSFRLRRRTAVYLTFLGPALLASLSACTTLPSSGPTAGQIVKAQKGPGNQIGYTIVDVTAETIAAAEQKEDTGLLALDALGAQARVEPADMIRPGDQLSVSIYEVGVSLFGSATPVGNSQAPVASPTANAQRVTVQVDEQGQIYIPYVGPIQAAGRLAADVQHEIQRRMRPMSQSPDVVIAVVDSVETVAYLTGAIAKPGRYRLSAAREKLIDLIALGGGPSLDPADAEVRLVRGDRVAVAKLADIRAEAAGNLVLLPGDRIEIVRNPRSFSVFGASDRVSQISFGGPNVSLTEAVARAGGPSDARANPAAVFVFRWEAANKPTIYRLDMKNPQSYFLSQRFAVRDKDVLYFSNSAANLPSKLINLINMLFSPLVTARILTQ